MPSSPPITPPKAEAGTNTGQSLFWRPPSPCSLPRDSNTPAAAATAGSQCDESSVCSNAMADLSVQTATSFLSQAVSEMHLDLQSYGTLPARKWRGGVGLMASLGTRMVAFFKRIETICN